MEGFTDFTQLTNLRIAWDVWPAGHDLPRDLDGVLDGAMRVALGTMAANDPAPIGVVRYADDGVSFWLIDRLGAFSLLDFVRSVGAAWIPHAYGMAVVKAGGVVPGTTLRPVGCEAMVGDDIVSVSGMLETDAAQPTRWRTRDMTVKRGFAHDDRGRWFGVPPDVEVVFPPLGGDT